MDHEISQAALKPVICRKGKSSHIAEKWVGTSWIVEMKAGGSRDGKTFHAQHLFLTSLRTTPEALLQLVRDRWSVEGWH